MSVESLCIHTVSVREKTSAPDRKGGNPFTWTDKYADINVRIQPLSANETTEWKGVPTIITHRIYDHDATHDIDETMIIVFGTREFNVIGVRNIDEWDRFLTIDAREIR